MRQLQEIIEDLSKPLDPSLTKQRKGPSGVTLTYLEGHVIIDHLNRIFGYGGWSYELVNLQRTCELQTKEEEPRAVVGYLAHVRVTARFGEYVVIREDVGHGQGISRSLPEAHESAVKEAVTDALKRACRTFGPQFGNSLYGSAENGERADSTKATAKQIAYLRDLIKQYSVKETLIRIYAKKKLGQAVRELEELSSENASELIGIIKQFEADTNDFLKEEVEG